MQEAARRLKALGKPFLDWAGKAERLSFDVPTLPLFVHERLSTEAIIQTLRGHRKGGVVQASLQVVAVGLGLVELLSEAQEFLAVAGVVEVVADGVGVSVEGLSAEAVLVGESRDVAVAAAEDGGGAGDAVAEG